MDIREQHDNMVQIAFGFADEISELARNLESLYDQINVDVFEMQFLWDNPSLDTSGRYEDRIDSIEHLMHATMGRLLDVAKMRTLLKEFYVEESIAGFILGQFKSQMVGGKPFNQDCLEKYIGENFCDTSEFDLDAIIDEVSFVDGSGNRCWRGGIDVDEIIDRNAWDRKDC